MFTVFIHLTLTWSLSAAQSPFSYCGELKYLHMGTETYGEIGVFSELQTPNFIKVRELTPIFTLANALIEMQQLQKTNSTERTLLEWSSEEWPDQSVQVCLEAKKLSSTRRHMLSEYSLSEVTRTRLWISGHLISDVYHVEVPKRRMGH